MLTDIEKSTYAAITKGKEFLPAIKSNNYALIDAFLLQRPHTNLVPEILNLNNHSIECQVEKLLERELIRTINSN